MLGRTSEEKALLAGMRATIAEGKLYVNLKSHEAEALLDIIDPDPATLTGMDALVVAVREVIRLGHEQQRFISAGATFAFAEGYDHNSPNAKWSAALTALDWALQDIDR